MALMAVAAGSVDSGGTAPTVFPNWESRVYQYEYRLAAEAGFAIGSVMADSAYRLLVMDTVRSAQVTTADGVELWGFGYRFLVEVNDIGLVGRLSLPAIAAAMEITAVEATIRLEVKGFKGDDMWGVIPAPKPLDVDTYSTYLTAVENIQHAFQSNPDNAYPVLLAKGGPDDIDLLIGGIDGPDLEAAVLLSWTLQRIADGASLATTSDALAAIDGMPLPEKAAALVEGTYGEVLGTRDPSASVDRVAAARADDLVSMLNRRS